MRVYKNKDRVEHRRTIVSRLMARQHTTREIAEILRNDARFLEDGGVPVSHQTIAKDMRAVRRQWHLRSLANVDEMRANQLAENREAKREAWKRGDLSALAKFMGLEYDLTGTRAAQIVKLLSELSDDEFDAAAESLFGAGEPPATAGGDSDCD